jgi:hypothetical protein
MHPSGSAALAAVHPSGSAASALLHPAVAHSPALAVVRVRNGVPDQADSKNDGQADYDRLLHDLILLVCDAA